jgi:GT2 family glycosyltransferase
MSVETLLQKITRVSVLIGSRNRPDVLFRCLESVLNQDYPALEVIVLDDASDQVDLCQVLAEHFSDPRLRCLRSDIQLGVAGGRNRLMAEATGDILCVIDDDAYFEDSNAIFRFVKSFCSDESIGIVACKVVDHRQGNNDLLVPFPKRWRRHRPDIIERAQYVSYYLGGCHAIRREVLNRCGMYAAELMFGEEELDLSYRAVAAGYRIYYEPAIVVHHHPQASVVAKGKKGEAKELYYHIQNRLYLAYRYLPSRYVPVYLGIWLGQYLVKAVQNGTPITFFAGVRDGILRLKRYRRTPLDEKAQRYLREHYGRLWY